MDNLVPLDLLVHLANKAHQAMWVLLEKRALKASLVQMARLDPRVCLVTVAQKDHLVLLGLQDLTVNLAFQEPLDLQALKDQLALMEIEAVMEKREIVDVLELTER